MREAKYYRKLEDNAVQCILCPHFCIIKNNSAGKCRMRQNITGILYAKNYAKTVSLALDPIEKKPLYHYRPGSTILSFGPNSCNLSCFFCQNYSISQNDAPTTLIMPEELLDFMLSKDMNQIAFTYSEPFTWFEYIYDFAFISQGQNISIVLVTNGFINQDPLRELLPFISAVNIDLKSIQNSFYKDHCGGSIQPVKDTIRECFVSGVHTELTNLLIPSLNTSEEDIVEMVDFIAGISAKIPLHISKYHPAYMSDIQATPEETILNACRIAEKRLHFVYAGNIYLREFHDTRCPICKTAIIKRNHSKVEIFIDSDGLCPKCQSRIYGNFCV